MIISNTTISRPSTLQSSSEDSSHPGGLSGKPLKELSTATIKDMALLTKGLFNVLHL